MKMKSSPKGFKVPHNLKIGERFLLSFHDPDLAAAPQLGRLQDLNADGSLCIDVAPECCPPRGTPVTISSLRRNTTDFRFSSEILGHRRLEGHLPVLLVKAPGHLELQQRRTSFRVAAALKARVEWEEEEAGLLSQPAVLTNLSGGGARLFVRRLPRAERLRLWVHLPQTFVEQCALRRLARSRTPLPRAPIFSDPFQRACEQLRAEFAAVEARLVSAHLHSQDNRGPVHALAVAFCQPHEGCYRLVSFLERQALQRGVQELAPSVATAA
jgi:hypothetical protein